jgi:hypothetical protein
MQENFPKYFMDSLCKKLKYVIILPFESLFDDIFGGVLISVKKLARLKSNLLNLMLELDLKINFIIHKILELIEKSKKDWLYNVFHVKNHVQYFIV